MYGQPKAGENPICQECAVVTPVKHDNCTEACSHLMSWLIHVSRQGVIDVAISSANSIRKLNDEREALRDD